MQENDITKWVATYEDVRWIDGNPWSLQNRILEPIHMPHTLQSVDPENVRDELRKTKALLAYWTDQWDRSESNWWWTICDNPEYDIETVESARGRRGIRKGLKNCSVYRLEAGDFSKLTYDIYIRNIKSYGSPTIPSYNQYAEDILIKSKYEGYELWGTFTGKQLAAFASCVVIDNAVILGSTKSDPILHSYSPNNAMFYQITKHYLCERKVKYISNGARTLLHSTSINEFLLRMGYRKVYCRLNLELSRMAKLIYYLDKGSSGILSNIINKILPEQGSRLSAFIKLVQIGDTF